MKYVLIGQLAGDGRLDAPKLPMSFPFPDSTWM
nr:MAG TPA: hypothetical protein [Caudoviricetes sp.]